MTGTELDWISDDYAQRLSVGAVEAYATLDDAITQLAANTTAEQQAAIRYSSCPLLNLTSCTPIANASSYTVILWNPQARSVSSVVRLPVYGVQTGETVVVRDAAGAVVVSDMLPVVATSTASLLPNNTASNVIAFVAGVQPLGYTAYSITITQSTTEAASLSNRHRVEAEAQADNVSIANSGVELTFDSATGLLTQWTDKRTASPTTHKFSQNFYWYQSSNTSSAGCSNSYYVSHTPQQ